MVVDVVIIEDVREEDVEGGSGSSPIPNPNSDAVHVHGTAATDTSSYDVIPGKVIGSYQVPEIATSKPSVFDRLSLPKEKVPTYGEVSILKQQHDPSGAPSYASKHQLATQPSSNFLPFFPLPEKEDIHATVAARKDKGKAQSCAETDADGFTLVMNRKKTGVSHDPLAAPTVVTKPLEPSIASVKGVAKTPPKPDVIPSVLKAFTKAKRSRPLETSNPFSVLTRVGEEGPNMHGVNGDEVVGDKPTTEIESS
ncbi:hypothetical protein L6452_09261 [Arctium lappa]|uniref:Uncharacterized protein n=1 Tax=Arctium lappa TaxID=4217 RepID=A0ACB9DJW2_ARCLA|nr:hypothetical protein L6452_09261 [Arctium lappa]